ncbi:MAG: Gfo/Idh/MocA family oxidoreductase, partial [Chloroflexota bacterium]
MTGTPMSDGPITLAILGAGNRGRHTYARYALEHPDEARVVAVADPDAGRRDALAVEHGATAHATWQELLTAHSPDLVIVATPDREHVAPTLAALERNLDVLLEKPIAPTEPEVRAVLAAAERSSGSVTVAHVLRYTPF